MPYSELAYFEGYAFAHIAAFDLHVRGPADRRGKMIKAWERRQEAR